MVRQVILHETDSTNRVAKELAREGAAHGSWVLAHRQTAGRGRLDRSFFSPEGGLYCSIILRPSIPMEDWVLLTPMAATAVRRAVHDTTGIQTDIKWVNDLYLDGKKVCGILCEAAGDAVIVGIGLNLRAPEGGFPPEINAAALEVACAPETLAAHITRELCKGCESLHLGHVPEEYRSHNLVCGRQLTVCPIGGEPYPACGKYIDCRGRLIVDTAGGEKTLDSGEVSIRF